MSQDVLVDKIVDLLQSEDSEIRKLGLSYLNSRKDATFIYLNGLDEAWKYEISYYKTSTKLYYSFKEIYERLLEYPIRNKVLLKYYVTECYNKKDC